MRKFLPILILLITLASDAQDYEKYRGYFRTPVNIPLEIVANVGELRTNHWHMGLDIRTQQRENIPVYAAADGYIAKVSIEPGGFGRAIYINHPNGYTTLYAHLNNFAPALHQWVIQQQYLQKSWAIKLKLPANLFPIKKGELIAYSGNTGGSAGPHVHFEVRETKTDKCVRPLMFGLPLADAVPPTIIRSGLYDRNRSVYDQSPQLFGVKKAGAFYNLTSGNTLNTGYNKVSFAITTYDRVSGSNNQNGIYKARVLIDSVLQSEFVIDYIDYNESRYMNAHIDYKLKANGGPYLQHLSRMPGDYSNVYSNSSEQGIIYLNDTLFHSVVIEVYDANNNISRLKFNIRYNPTYSKNVVYNAGQKFIPQQVNVFESDRFEVFTTEYTVYDTVHLTYKLIDNVSGNAISPIHNFNSAAIPVHDNLTVRIRPSLSISAELRDKILIKNIAGSRTYTQKATWQSEWVSAKFRQFGSYQAFIDTIPPTINAPGYGDTIDLRRSTRLVFTPQDNFKSIKSFKAEVTGQWLLFTNDKGSPYIYRFDQYFPTGVNELTVFVEDLVGNVTRRTWYVRR